MKQFLFLIMVSVLCLSSCFSSFFDLGEEKVEEPEARTFLIFNNTGNTPVRVYSASDRLISSEIITLPATRSSDPRKFSPQPNGYWFYFTYDLPIGGIRIPYIPPMGKGDSTEAIIQRGEENTLIISPLSRHFGSNDILIEDVFYIAIKNSGTSVYRLLRGTSNIIPESLNGSSSPAVSEMINPNDTAVYKIAQTDISGYKITANINDYPISTAITSPEKGHLYLLNFTGTAVSQTADTPITLANVR